MMHSLDLFSCIGCHAIGFERAGIFPVAFCESKPYRRMILADRFPGIPIYGDVCELSGQRLWDDGNTVSIQILVGGPPCQRTSVAAAIHGKRTGESLWPHMLRICHDILPQWVVVEQPTGNSGWETEVADGLARIGYHSARAEFEARDIGAPFERRRVFILACTSLPRLEVAWRAIPSEIAAVKRAADARGDWAPGELESLRVDDDPADRLDKGRRRRERIEALGDSNPPHMAEVIGRVITSAIGL